MRSVEAQTPVAGESIEALRSRLLLVFRRHGKGHTMRLERCLCCKLALPDGVSRYCDETCREKSDRTKRAPGRVAARRRRRRGGRKL
jgi:hypothetical protein